MDSQGCSRSSVPRVGERRGGRRPAVREDLRKPDISTSPKRQRVLRHLVGRDWGWREELIGRHRRSYVWDHGFVLDVTPSTRLLPRGGPGLPELRGVLDDLTLNEPIKLGGLRAAAGIVVAHITSHGTQRPASCPLLHPGAIHPGDLDNMLAPSSSPGRRRRRSDSERRETWTSRPAQRLGEVALRPALRRRSRPARFPASLGTTAPAVFAASFRTVNGPLAPCGLGAAGYG
jgi:hypothetical protein